MTIYLMVNGSRLAPEISHQDQLVFRLELPVHEIRLVSGHARPADIAGGEDYRRVGVALHALRWQQGARVIESSVESPSFIDGFHLVEQYQHSDGPFRWTNGNAGLPPGLMPPWQGETLLHLRLSEWQGSALHPPPEPAAAVLGAFENLGEHCEFSLAQRHYGVEAPLTLYRWAGTTCDKLLLGLETRFEGLGEPTRTEMVWRDDDYRLQTPYLNFHTNATERRNAAGAAIILGDGCAALRLLRRKLLADIAAARRIFVFHTTDPAFDDERLHHLHGAMRAIGPASLLGVTLRPPGGTADSVEQIGPGLYAGHIERFVIPDGPFDAWLALCSRTLALHHAG